MAKKQFKAESKRLLDLMIHSIYTHREIFLRELISNASDAIDKLCFKSLTDENVGMARSDFRIRLTCDKDNGILIISDNGIGMTKEDMENNLGVIARSGSLAFKKELDAAEAEKADIDIIGQFGVGFYAAFMVAESVTVVSRAYGSDCGAKWESDGADGYTVSDFEKDTVGTNIVLKLKPDTEEECYSVYAQPWKIQELVKKYSDYVRWPIRMDVERTEKEETDEVDETGIPKVNWKTVVAEETVNSMVPIWQRSRKDATDEDCIAFYKEAFRDPEDPVAVIRVNAEGLVSYRCLLFVPAKAPYDYFSRDYAPGLRLYSNGVMIMEKCADLLPECFRFVRGVVDSPDLSLNISRELLQHDRQLKMIASNLEKKIKAELTKLMENDRSKYETFYNAFGIQLKYGIVGDFGAKKDMLTDLLLYHSAAEDKLISLKQYVAAMPESQKRIYFAAADTAQRAVKLPQTEQLRDRGYDFLCFTSDVDEFVAEIIGLYEGKSFCNVNAQELGLESDEERAEAEKAVEANKELVAFIKEQVGDAVESVKVSRKLKNHAVCLSAEGEITLEMERYFHTLPGVDANAMRARRVLEINADHAAIKALDAARQSDTQRAVNMAKVLLAQAELVAGMMPEDPTAYTELVCSLF